MGVWGVASGHAPPPLSPPRPRATALRAGYRSGARGWRFVHPLPGRNDGLKAPRRPLDAEGVAVLGPVGDQARPRRVRATWLWLHAKRRRTYSTRPGSGGHPTSTRPKARLPEHAAYARRFQGKATSQIFRQRSLAANVDWGPSRNHLPTMQRARRAPWLWPGASRRQTYASLGTQARDPTIPLSSRSLCPWILRCAATHANAREDKNEKLRSPPAGYARGESSRAALAWIAREPRYGHPCRVPGRPRALSADAKGSRAPHPCLPERRFRPVRGRRRPGPSVRRRSEQGAPLGALGG